MIGEVETGGAAGAVAEAGEGTAAGAAAGTAAGAAAGTAGDEDAGGGVTGAAGCVAGVCALTDNGSSATHSATHSATRSATDNEAGSAEHSALAAFSSAVLGTARHAPGRGHRTANVNGSRRTGTMAMQRKTAEERLAWAADWARQWATLSGVATQDTPAGALYVVATPIGNAADLTLRALWVLSMADAIAAEDTRVTRQLLERYGLTPPALLAAHEHNERAAAERIFGLLQAGERVALVTDAGTPGVSDPGARIVAAVQAAGLRVVPVPGASSLLAAVSAAGLAAQDLHFLGFLPTGAKERARRLDEAAALPGAFLLLEAPHRLADTLAALHAALAPTRRVVVARELTKKFESIEVLTAGALADYAAAHTPRGEYVLVIDADTAAAPTPTTIDPATHAWLRALAEALPASKAAAVAAKATGLPRALLYDALARTGVADA